MKELYAELATLKHPVVDFLKPAKGEDVAHLRIYVHPEQHKRALGMIKTYLGRNRLLDKVKVATYERLQPREFAKSKTDLPRMLSNAIVLEGRVSHIAKLLQVMLMHPNVEVPPRSQLAQG